MSLTFQEAARIFELKGASTVWFLKGDKERWIDEVTDVDPELLVRTGKANARRSFGFGVITKLGQHFGKIFYVDRSIPFETHSKLVAIAR